MPVIVASALRKEFAGTLLFEDVSFALDRGERLALAGANGAGKTTLLQAIAGRTELQAGELALQKGARIALHDQRPPLQRGLDLRQYMLSASSDLLAAEEELKRLDRHGGGRPRAGDPAPLRRDAGLA